MIHIFSNLLKHKLLDRGLTLAKLAALLGCTPSNLYQKMKLNNFSENAMVEISETLGLKLKIRLKKI